MAKSAKAKKEKKKDFQKAKLRVGKTKAKADNFTDTSFKARSISVLQQSLTSSAPTTGAQFSHHLSLLTHPSSNQRLQSLQNLTKSLQTCASLNQPPPAPTATILVKAQPLLLDASSTAVRTQTLKLLAELRTEDVKSQARSILLFIRAGMTNLSTGVRVSAVECLDWLLNVAATESVSAPGGWIKTLQTFLIVLQWQDAEDAKATGFSSIKSAAQTQGWKQSTSATAGKTPEQITLLSRSLTVLSTLITAGFRDDHDVSAEELHLARISFPLTHAWNHMRMNNGGANDAFGYLNLFGRPSDTDDERSLESPEERRTVFGQRFLTVVEKGVEAMKREGGTIGRAASDAEKSIKIAWAKDSEAN